MVINSKFFKKVNLRDNFSNLLERIMSAPCEFITQSRVNSSYRVKLIKKPFLNGLK